MLSNEPRETSCSLHGIFNILVEKFNLINFVVGELKIIILSMRNIDMLRPTEIETEFYE